MSRKPADINEKDLKELMRLRPTLEDTGAFFECSGRTIERYIRDNFDLTFVEFRERHMVHTRMKLIQTALSKAIKGDNTMMIMCLCNLCGWKRNDEKDSKNVVINNFSKMTSEQLDAKIKELSGEVHGSQALT